MPATLGENELKKVLNELTGWKLRDGKLVKVFEFRSFKEAMSFLVRIAFHAEEQQHHPEIHNVYNKVTITLSTHDAGGQVTEKDTQLARTIDHVSWV